MIPHLLNACSDGIGAVMLKQLRQSALAQSAGRKLGAQIAQTRFREAHVVCNDLPEIFVELSSAICFYGAQLQSFFVDFGRLHRTEANAPSADVEPMGAHGGKSDQLVVNETRSIDDHVVQVLSANVRRVHHNRITGLEAAEAEFLDAIQNRDSHVGEKD